MVIENRLQLIDSRLQSFKLVEEGGVLSLVDQRPNGLQPIAVEFPAHLKSARGRSELPSQPLIRAIGRKSKSVIDATAGMGQDSFMMAAFGFSVVALERSEQIAALLQNGLDRAVEDIDIHNIIDGHLQFLYANAIQYLRQIETKPDVIFLDPMYPPKRKKSALAKKEMQILREVVGDDSDTEELFAIALDVAKYRVVVKRPHYAKPIQGEPSMSYEGKLVRYDVYLTSIKEKHPE